MAVGERKAPGLMVNVRLTAACALPAQSVNEM